MDTSRFDSLTRALATPAGRRAALRLLGAGLLGGVVVGRGAAPGAAQRPDRDFDGLFDDDELFVYGTDPDNPDSDGDGFDDGLEVYNGTDPLTNPAPPPLTCPPGGPGTNCGTYCASLETDFFNCGGCGNVCSLDTICIGGLCQPPRCFRFGERCLADFECCPGFVCGADNVCLFPSIGA